MLGLSFAAQPAAFAVVVNRIVSANGAISFRAAGINYSATRGYLTPIGKNGSRRGFLYPIASPGRIAGAVIRITGRWNCFMQQESFKRQWEGNDAGEGFRYGREEQHSTATGLPSPKSYLI